MIKSLQMYNHEDRKLIFLYTSVSTGGGQTYFKLCSSILDQDKLMYWTLEGDTITGGYAKATLRDVLNKKNILVSNSQIISLILLLIFPLRKCIYVTHGYANALGHISTFRRLIANAIFRCPWSRLVYIACGNDEFNSIKKLVDPKKKCYLVKNATKMIEHRDVFEGYTSNQRYIFIGRLSYQKGLDLLLQALNRLASPVTLDIAGPIQPGEKALYYDMLAEIRKLNENGHKINFIGEVQVNQDLLKNYRLALLPSRFEGLPYTLLELISFSMPILVSDCLGHSEFRKFLPESMFFRTGSVNSLVEKLENVNEITVHRCSYDAISSEYSLAAFKKHFVSVIQHEF